MNEIIYLINSLLDPIINNENYFLIFISIINIISWTCYYYITHNDRFKPPPPIFYHEKSRDEQSDD